LIQLEGKTMIDFHTHPVMIKELLNSDTDLDRSIHEVFGFHFPSQPLECFLLEMDEAGIDTAVLLPLDCTSAHACQIVSNEQVAELVDKTPRFIGFASVDPNRPDAPANLERAVHHLGLRGLKLDPSLQCFDPASQDCAYPLYQACAALDVPVLLHCGMSWAPSGLAEMAQPLRLEKAIQTFPTVKFILAHFAWPWVQEATMLAVKYPNVFLDTAILYSGTPRDALKHVLAEQVGLDVVERSLYHKIVFGTNYPRVDMRRCVRGLRALGLSPTTEQAIFSGTASYLLKLERQP
jgi:predicted TIM-barrel fold metal-dependent hydrolase